MHFCPRHSILQQCYMIMCYIAPRPLSILLLKGFLHSYDSLSSPTYKFKRHFKYLMTLLVCFRPHQPLHLLSVDGLARWWCPTDLWEMDFHHPRFESKQWTSSMSISNLVLMSFVLFSRNTYTSSLLDGAARNYLLFTWIRKTTQDFATSHVWMIFFLSPYTRGEKKNHLVWAGIEPRSSYFSSDRSSH